MSASIFSLASCDLFEEENNENPIKNPNEIVELVFKGAIEKRHYSLSDDWDFTGLKVYTNTRDNKTKVLLNEDEYTLSTKTSVKNFSSSLVINAVLNSDKKIKGTYTANYLSVDSPSINSKAEISEYYSGFNFNLSGEDLRAELQELSFETHTHYVKYNEVARYRYKSSDYESTDLIPNESRQEMFYTGKKATFGVGTREHVWACDHSNHLWFHGGSDPSKNVDSGDYIGGGSDLYHIRPVDYDLNTAKGTAAFVDFSDSEFSSLVYEEFGETNGLFNLKLYWKVPTNIKEYANLAEIDDQQKGDLARIFAYILMHYKTSSKTPSEFENFCGDLDIMSVMGYSTKERCFQKLIEWNNLDPVSNVELYRNHTVQLIQGNRNPFVDIPDLMEKVFSN